MNISHQPGVSPLRGTGRIQAASLSAAPSNGGQNVADVPGGDGAPPTQRIGQEVLGRLDAAADKLRSHLSDIVGGEQLSADQVSELREAEVQFQQTLDRIHNALDGRGLAPDTLRRGYRTAINEMRSAVQDVLAGDGSVGEVPSDDTPVDGPRMVNLNQAGIAAQQERIGEPGGEVADEEDPTLRRIAFAENRISERIDQMLESDDLSASQQAALLETRDAFSATLDRLRNAMEGDIAPVTVARGFAEAMGGVRAGMREALAADDSGVGPVGELGAAEDAGDRLSPVGEGEVMNDPPSVIDPQTARRLEQLHNAADSIAGRLENILSKDGLGDHQVAALETARDDFRTSLDALRKSLMSSDMDVSDVRKAFMSALDGLVGDVHAAMNTSAPPVLYTEAEGLEFMGRESSDVDRTA